MTSANEYDAIVIGSGPNGLAAAITLAQEECRVLVLEANATIGGGLRSAELTLPGFVHDLCSSIHPMGAASPFFRLLPLERYGLEWIQPDLPLAHPLNDGEAVALHRSLAETADALGSDRDSYRRLMEPLVAQWDNLAREVLQPVLHVPRHPFMLARFGLNALQPAMSLARRCFQTEAARALFAGSAAHSFLPLEKMTSAAIGLVLNMMGHAVGWPMPRGGSQKIADALAAHLRSLGGQTQTNTRVENIDQLPPARAILADVSPRQLLRIAGHRLPARYCRALERYRYNPSIFKVDYALAAPIPWKIDVCSRAGTLHLGGTLEELALAERQVTRGENPERPFVLLAQHSVFDATRAPTGKHTAWAYCHTAHGSNVDLTNRIEQQIERFAPGFRDRVLERHRMGARELEAKNANLIGGDINGGVADLRQLLARPVFSLVPYRTPLKGLYLCSASTPPGGGVHGMCGYHAARAALRREFGCQNDRNSVSRSLSL